MPEFKCCVGFHPSNEGFCKAAKEDDLEARGSLNPKPQKIIPQPSARAVRRLLGGSWLVRSRVRSMVTILLTRSKRNPKP